VLVLVLETDEPKTENRLTLALTLTLNFLSAFLSALPVSISHRGFCYSDATRVKPVQSFPRKMQQHGFMTILELIGFGEGVTAARTRLATRCEEPGALPPIEFRFLAQREAMIGKRATSNDTRKRPQEVRCASAV
jgi:hypothetical protein